ncbi:hypothetical protein GCM10009558_103540 [Virgisporangium aurantiacum]
MTAAVSEELSGVLDGIEVDLVRRRATVGDREVVAENRKQLQAMLASTLYDARHAGRRPADTPQPANRRDRDFERRW